MTKLCLGLHEVDKCKIQKIIFCRFAQENDLVFVETSAKSGENVEEAFLKCSKTILAKIETGELDPERIGSGIQYGESLLRRNQQNNARRAPDCSNLPCKF